MKSLFIIILIFSTAFAEETKFPSAKECASCHPEHYKEWSVSPHSYAQISPVFNSMHATTVERTNGTTGDFCIRCHNPVGMQKSEPVVQSNLERHAVSNEGVTCVVCHRRDENVGKNSSRNRIIEGDIFAPVYGSFDSEELKKVLEEGNVNTDPKKEGRDIHLSAHQFKPISKSSFCGSCHDVNNINGFRLEEAFSDYKSSPASLEGTSCQDCHMSKEPGKAAGYDRRSIAIVGGKPTKIRKKTNHMFIGPDYSVVHPGIFPHSISASKFATPQEWLEFDIEAGWGTDDFEDETSEDYEFPTRWSDVDERYEAREIIEESIELLEKAHEERKKLLKIGYQLGQIDIEDDSDDKLAFSVEVKNGTNGHSVPTGFDGERIVFLRVSVADSEGRIVFKSGDLDPNGDLRDSHSLYVKAGKIEKDKYLFNLQSKFLVDMNRGGDREAVLPINHSISALPFLRPATSATILTGRPTAARKHRKGIPANSSKWGKYRVGKKALKNSKAPYTAKIELVAGMIPVHLVHEVSDVGFDYNMSAKQIASKVVQGHQVLWEKKVTLGQDRELKIVKK